MSLLSHFEPSLESFRTKERMPEDRSSSLCGCRIKLKEKKDKQDDSRALHNEADLREEIIVRQIIRYIVSKRALSILKKIKI